MKINWHNPKNVPTSSLPTGYRFLTAEEFEQDYLGWRKSGKARLWWKPEFGSPEIQFGFPENTFCIPKADFPLYRAVKLGEILQEGDERFDPVDGWVARSAFSFGNPMVVRCHKTRRLATVPDTTPKAEKQATEPAPVESKAPGLPSRVVTPRVFAGYGYRFLKAGEVFQKGDEVLLDTPEPLSESSYGEAVRKSEYGRGPWPEGYYRRPIEVGAGYRLVDESEIIEDGDELIERDPDTGHLRQLCFFQPLVKCLVTRAAGVKENPNCFVRRRLNNGLPVSEAVTSTASLVDTLRAEVRSLQEQLRDARGGCRRLKKELENSRRYSDALQQDCAGYREQLSAAKRNVEGNVVLVTQDGFSKPLSIAYTGDGAAHCIKMAIGEVGTLSWQRTFRSVTFVRTSKTDGFGRVIYNEAN